MKQELKEALLETIFNMTPVQAKIFDGVSTQQTNTNHTTFSAVSLILKAIKANGLEKTLEDLNRVCNDERQYSDEAYIGMLSCIQSYNVTRKK